jgi:hypothetical protein
MGKSMLFCSVAGCLVAVGPAALAAGSPTAANPICPDNTALYDPGNGQNIVVPAGYKVSVFAAGLNFPTGIAFRRVKSDSSLEGNDGFANSGAFEVYVLESGHGLPSSCNEQDSFGSGQFDPKNPFTPDILVFDEAGKLIRSPLAKPVLMTGCSQLVRQLI